MALAVVGSALLFAGCSKDDKKQGDSVPISECVGTYEGQMKIAFSDIETPDLSAYPDGIKKLVGNYVAELKNGHTDKFSFNLTQNPSDKKGIILTEVAKNPEVVYFTEGESVSNGVLFNVMRLTKGADEDQSDEVEYSLKYSLERGAQMYYLEVNGKKTKLYDALYEINKNSFALSLQLKLSLDVKPKDTKLPKLTVTTVGSYEFEGKKK